MNGLVDRLVDCLLAAFEGLLCLLLVRYVAEQYFEFLGLDLVLVIILVIVRFFNFF
jgi:hypothetical protein